MARNIEQCLNDFNIPLKLSHTVVQIHGKERLEGVTIAQVDENRKPVAGSEEFIACDTLLLSVGLIPENELSKSAKVALSPITSGAVVDQDRQTNIPGIFACGNVLHVHDLVDFVSQEAEIAGKAAAAYIEGNVGKKVEIPVKTDGKVRYTVPQVITEKKEITLYFRVGNVYKNVRVKVTAGDKVILTKKRPKVAPGEMESVTIQAEALEDVKELLVSLEVV